MSYKTVEVELENGYVRPSGSETLPSKAHGFLTLLDDGAGKVALSCTELANRWTAFNKLSPQEASEFADDIEKGRASVLPPGTEWD